MSLTPQVLVELTERLLGGELTRADAAKHAASIGPTGLYVHTFEDREADGHHLLLTHCTASLSNPRTEGPPYFFRDSDILYSLQQMQRLDSSRTVIDGVVQERAWSDGRTATAGPMVYLGTLAYTADELEARSAVRFVRGLDDLEVELFANLLSQDRACRLACRSLTEHVAIACFEVERAQQLQALVLALECLYLDLEDLEHVTEDLDTTSLPRWTLWRQDDNGNQFDVRTFSSRAKAERAADRFEARGHKQMYVVKRSDTKP